MMLKITIPELYVLNLSNLPDSCAKIGLYYY